MSASFSQDLELDALRSEIVRLRSQLTLGAPIVPLASVRARDRAEAVHGTVVSLGLSSSLFFDNQFGEYTAMDKPRVHLFEGTLTSRHISSLLPLFEEVARERALLVLAVGEVDEQVLAMVALNKNRGSMGAAIILPTTPGTPAPLHILQRLTGAKLGAATDGGLRIEPPAMAQRMLLTLHETVLISGRQLPTDLPSLGLLHVGGEDMATARARARAAREMIARSRLS